MDKAEVERKLNRIIIITTKNESKSIKIDDVRMEKNHLLYSAINNSYWNAVKYSDIDTLEVR